MLHLGRGVAGDLDPPGIGDADRAVRAHLLVRMRVPGRPVSAAYCSSSCRFCGAAPLVAGALGWIVPAGAAP